MKTRKFTLFSDCIPVKGINRSIICDTLSNDYYFIPNGLYDILEKYDGETVEFVKKEFENEYDEIIDEYFDFLFSKNIIFYTAKPEFFPKISLEWDSPSIITNAIIDYENVIHDFKDIIQQLELLKCSHLQLRFFSKVHLEFVANLLTILNQEKSRILSIDFILPYNKSFEKSDIDLLIENNSRVHSFILYNAPQEKKYDAMANRMGYFIQTKRQILNEKSCGIISSEYFYANIKLFTESLNHNTCLNRKISIDRLGNIKNCPSMSESYGNIKNTTLKKVIADVGFKKYWNINKDQIDICKDCEFRHICTDCRAYKEDPENDYSKPLKCGYDPYTNEWKDWSTNPLKEKAIEFYGMKDIIKS